MAVPVSDAFLEKGTSPQACSKSTFILTSQNLAAAAAMRADLDLQWSLLAEHEVTRTEADADLDEITQDVAHDAVLDELEAAEPEAEQP